MKRKNWKQRLREEAQLHLPAPREPDGESYLQPDSARFLPAGSLVKTAARYGLPALAAAAALVCVALLARGMASLPAGDSASSAFAAATEHTGAPSTAAVPSPASSADTTAASHTTAMSEPAPPTTTTAGSVDLSPAGDLVFSTVLETPALDWEIRDYAPLADGGFAVVGITGEYQTDTAFAARCDAQGKWLFTRFFGGNRGANFYKVIATQDGGFLACGNTASTEGGDFDTWNLTGRQGGSVLFVKYSAAGEVQWARVVNAHSITGYAANSVREAADGSLLGMVGDYNSTGGPTTYYRFHWDAQGNPLTANVLEPVNADADHIIDVFIEQDGSFTAVGEDGTMAVFFQLNPDGSEAFRREFSNLTLDGLRPTAIGFALHGNFSSRTTTADLEKAAITPLPTYRSGTSSGVFFCQMHVDGTPIGGDMILGSVSNGTGFARYVVTPGEGRALYMVHDLGTATDPFPDQPADNQLYIYSLNVDGRLAVRYSCYSDMFTGTYDGLDGLFIRPDGSVLAVCMENLEPSFIRVLRLQDGSTE